MLSSEGNENGEKKNNNRANQQKSNFGRAAHFFCTLLCRCFARLQRETSRNFLVTRFMEEMSCVFLFIFFTAAHFHLGGRQHFLFSHRRYKIFMFFFQRKNVSFVFYLSLCLLLLFSLSFPGLSPTFSFSLSPSSLYSKFVDMTINLSLILSRTRIQKKFRLY